MVRTPPNIDGGCPGFMLCVAGFIDTVQLPEKTGQAAYGVVQPSTGTENGKEVLWTTS